MFDETNSSLTNGLIHEQETTVTKSYLEASFCLAAISLLLLGSPAYAQTPVRDLDNPARQPFRIAAAQLTAAPGVTIEFGLMTIPAGKRLVIEQVTFLAVVAPNKEVTRLRVGVKTTTGDHALPHWVPIHRQLGDFVANHQMRVYADPGTPVGVSLLVQGNGLTTTDVVIEDLAISGYFVDLN